MKTWIRLTAAIVGFTVALIAGSSDVRAQNMHAREIASPAASNVQGIKSKLVTQAVKLMAKALRKGEKPFFEACEKLASDPRAFLSVSSAH